MSTRVNLFAVQSMDPILKTVGSGDKDLVAEIAPDKDSQFYVWANQMIGSKRPPKAEPGAWNYVVQELAEHLELEPEKLDLDDWKHSYVWDDYIAMVDECVSEGSLELLQMLSAGRPLKGDRIDYDGCVFAWLTSAEAKRLLNELLEIDEDSMVDGEGIDFFHGELVSSLKTACKKDAAVFLASH